MYYIIFKQTLPNVNDLRRPRFYSTIYKNYIINRLRISHKNLIHGTRLAMKQILTECHGSKTKIK